MKEQTIPELLANVKQLTDELQAVQNKDTQNALSYIRKSYAVPVDIGVCVYYTGEEKSMEGIIVGARIGRLEIVCDDGHLHLLHPTWELSYG